MFVKEKKHISQNSLFDLFFVFLTQAAKRASLQEKHPLKLEVDQQIGKRRIEPLQKASQQFLIFDSTDTLCSAFKRSEAQYQAL